MVAVAADSARRGEEFDRLVGCIRSTMPTVAYATASLGTMTSYIAPSLAVDPEQSVKNGLKAMVRDRAAAVLPDLRAAASACPPGRILPWHYRLRSADGAYRAYLAAMQDYLASVAEDYEMLTEGQPELDDRLARLQVALRRAAGDTAGREAADRALRSR